MAPTYFEQFRSQRTGNIKNKKVLGILDSAAAIEAKLQTDHAAIQSDTSRSAQWKSDEARKLATKAVKDLHKNVLDLKREQRAVDAKRPTVPRLDKSNTVGALEDWEIRQFIRSMPSVSERVAYIHRLDNDGRIVAAIIRSAPDLLGVPKDVHQRLVESVLEETHGALLKTMAEDTEAVETADAGLQLVLEAARKAAGFREEHQMHLWNGFVGEIVTPMNAEFATETAKPPTRDIGIDDLVANVRSAPIADRRLLINRLRTDADADEQAHFDREMARLRGEAA
jgi:hypothetical protein